MSHEHGGDRIGCACRVMDRFECIELRYFRTHIPDLDFGEIEADDREPCTCACHDQWDDDGDEDRP